MRSAMRRKNHSGKSQLQLLCPVGKQSSYRILPKISLKKNFFPPKGLAGLQLLGFSTYRKLSPPYDVPRGRAVAASFCDGRREAP